MSELRIKLLRPSAKLPKRSTTGSAGYVPGLVVCDDLDETQQGVGGFGSSGLR